MLHLNCIYFEYMLIEHRFIFNQRTLNMKNVLLVDDSMFIRSQIRGLLEAQGFNVVGEAANGEEAIDLALELQPDLITLDNVLPDMLGIEILRVYKKHGLRSKIIMISAVGQQSMQQKAIELGASAYVVKPIAPDALQKALENADEEKALKVA